jgi:hypothetical protein
MNCIVNPFPSEISQDEFLLILNANKIYNNYKNLVDANEDLSTFFNQYKDTIEQIRVIEERLLKKTCVLNKTPQYKIYEQLKNGNIKVFSDTSEKIGNMFLLKIAGIWKTNNEYGLTYKFICC